MPPRTRGGVLPESLDLFAHSCLILTSRGFIGYADIGLRISVVDYRNTDRTWHPY